MRHAMCKGLAGGGKVFFSWHEAEKKLFCEGNEM